MILPTKGVPPQQALLSLGAEVLRLLDESKTVSRLWDDFRRHGHVPVATFDWFVLGLDLLFALDAIEFERGRLRRSRGSSGAVRA
jgi:hypothetical protein